ncbi:hypothetical protein DL766_005027 [Monosporascus sp. MC13-8B]|uniref:non-specific serine/threonine protein kinase n=1 Tax=Monosporascus cannonballus TaxID=155416 RepID=A0ABY0GU20_9PEZI|nr:hypothetical protein DL762_009178 [Monosporascus cannonballus]RYO85160.1 hypothetical protein DL763_007183 [Monosporascus cannonballus]RYP30091.1 hypothetical protein DL766_005027 [Monosporascus sp. MC13-8B]
MAFEDPFHSTLESALDYDFVTELAPGVWKVYEKDHKFELLAYDITDQLFTNPEQPWNGKRTELWELLQPDNGAGILLDSVSQILRHENLVSLVDVVQVRKSNFGGPYSRERWYTIWEFCDAGNLANLLVRDVKSSKYIDITTDGGVARIKVRGAKEDATKEQETKKHAKGKGKEIRKEDANCERKETRINMQEGHVPPAGERTTTYIDLTKLQISEFLPKFAKLQGSRFLPESLCWHVLCSVLKALAWLHDGVTSLKFNEQLGQYIEMGPDDPYWQPILHRNITPANIFFTHPKRHETYGLCKLGNFGQAFVSDLSSAEAEAARYILAPPQGQSFAPLYSLREKAFRYGDAYPPLEDQPYTMTSEYRALGEVILGMMVTPVTSGIDHMSVIRGIPVAASLGYAKRAGYSSKLLLFVQWLMEMSIEDMVQQMEKEAGWSRGMDGTGQPLVTKCTSALYVWAFKRYLDFRASFDPARQDLIMVEEAIHLQRAEDELHKQQKVAEDILMTDILDKQDKLAGDNPRDHTGKLKDSDDEYE